MADDPLLDVFVNVKVKDEVLRATETAIDEAVNRIKAKFGSMATQVSIATAQAASAAAGVGGGGGSGGGRGATAALADHYRAALRAAQDLAIETGRVGKIVRELGDEDVAQNFKVAANELKDLQLAMRRGREDADPLALRSTLDRLQLVRQRLEEISRVGSENRFGTRDVQAQFRQLVEAEAVARPNFNIESQLRLSSLQGLNFKDRNTIRELVADVQKAQVNFDHLKRTFDGTEDSLDRLILAWAQLNSVQGQTPFSGDLDARIQNVAGGLDSVRSKLLQTTAEMGQSGRSFNTLSNNAYQIGQAFEDAAVGFSLNGFAGAVRGAANNVAFILNDMSRLESIQKAVGARWAQQIPLIAGIGSALAITVLPRIIEWLESLNDIEAKFRDISDELAESFEDRKINIEFTTNNAQLERGLEQTKSVSAVLKQISDINFDLQQKRQALGSIFSGLSESQLIGDESDLDKIKQQIGELNALAGKQIADALKTEADRGAIPQWKRDMNDNFIRIFSLGLAESDTTILSNAKALKDQMFQVTRAIEETFDSAAAGTLTVDTLVRAQRTLATLKADIPSLIPSLDLADPETAIKSLNGVLDNHIKILKEAEGIQREIANTMNEEFVLAFDVARNKVLELQDQLTLTRNVALGVNVEFDLDLLALDEQINEGRKIITESIQAIREAGARNGIKIDESGIQAIEEEFATRSILSLEQLQSKNLKEKLDLEKKILEAKEKQAGVAKFTDFDAFARQLQLNALNEKDDVRKKQNLQELLDELEAEKEDIRRTSESLDRVRGDRRFNDIAGARRAADIDIQTIDFTGSPVLALMNNLMAQSLEELKRQTAIQKKTNDGVQKLDVGAKAQ